MIVPYATATSGERAREEIRKLLQRFGCDSVGFMDEFTEQRLLLAFEWRASGCSSGLPPAAGPTCTCERIRGTTVGGAPRTSGATRRSNRAWWR